MFLAKSYASFSVSILQTWTTALEPLRLISLRLDVYSPPQFLQINGRPCHLVLAFLVVRDVANSRAALLHGRYAASSLLRAQPPPSRLGPLSRCDLRCSADFSTGRGGLLQLLGMSFPPCCRISPRRGGAAASIRFRLPMLPSRPRPESEPLAAPAPGRSRVAELRLPAKCARAMAAMPNV